MWNFTEEYVIFTEKSVLDKKKKFLWDPGKEKVSETVVSKKKS